LEERNEPFADEGGDANLALSDGTVVRWWEGDEESLEGESAVFGAVEL